MLYDETKRPLIADFIYGLGGRDASPQLIKGIFDRLAKIKKEGRVSEAVNYVGVRQ